MRFNVVVLGFFGTVASCASASSELAAPAPSAAEPGDASAAADPTGFRAAGSLVRARSQATATRLADGRVLVVGGEDTARRMLASVEIVDPKTDTSIEVAPLPEARAYHSATLLADGKVLVAGGGPGSEISLPTGETTFASAFVYDVASNAWSTIASMHGARAGHRAVRLADGRVLVVGGGSGVGYACASSHRDCTVAESIGSAEIYDAKADVWTETRALTKPRIGFSLDMTPLGVVAAGGAASNKGLTSVEIYDPSLGVWRNGPDLSGQRLYHATAVLSEKLVVAGGKIANVGPRMDLDILDPTGASWTKGASLAEARTGAAFVALSSGRGLLIAGNNQLGNAFLDDAAIYDPTADTWTPIASLAKGRYGHAAVVLDDGSVLVVGGRAASGVLALLERSR